MNAPRPVTVLDPNDTHAAIVTRALLDERQERGTLRPTRVETLHKTVIDIHEALDPQDVDRPLNQGFMRYVNGKAAFAFRRPDGSWENPMGFTRNALGQMGYRVLGAGGAKFLDNQRKRGTHGTKLAEVNWNHALQQEAKPALVRTVQLPGQKHRTARAVLSGGGRGYSVIDNVDVLEMFMEAPELRELPIIEAHITPDIMRIRGLLNPEDAILFDENGKLRNPGNSHFVGLDLPIPMWELFNGEIGNSALRFNYGQWFARCLNGLGGYGGDNSAWRWNHVGGEDRGERIKSGLASAIKSARVLASGQLEDYKAATEVGIDNAFALLDSWGDKDLTGDQLQRAKDAMQDETSYPGKKLASVVDGITLAAQSETDVLKQRSLEAFAARILQKGLEVARKAGGHIAAEAA